VRRVSVTAILMLALVLSAAAADIVLPMKEGSIRFLVIGDSGTGGGAQKQVADRIAEVHKVAVKAPATTGASSRSPTNRCSMPTSSSSPRSGTTTIRRSVSTNPSI
jgi:opacity protein-like surface antigen